MVNEMHEYNQSIQMRNQKKDVSSEVKREESAKERGSSASEDRSSPNDHTINRILQIQNLTPRINLDLLGQIAKCYCFRYFCD